MTSVTGACPAVAETVADGSATECPPRPERLRPAHPVIGHRVPWNYRKATWNAPEHPPHSPHKSLPSHALFRRDRSYVARGGRTMAGAGRSAGPRSDWRGFTAHGSASTWLMIEEDSRNSSEKFERVGIVVRLPCAVEGSLHTGASSSEPPETRKSRNINEKPDPSRNGSLLPCAVTPRTPDPAPRDGATAVRRAWAERSSPVPEPPDAAVDRSGRARASLATPAVRPREPISARVSTDFAGPGRRRIASHDAAAELPDELTGELHELMLAEDYAVEGVGAGQRGQFGLAQVECGRRFRGQRQRPDARSPQ